MRKYLEICLRECSRIAIARNRLAKYGHLGKIPANLIGIALVVVESLDAGTARVFDANILVTQILINSSSTKYDTT